MDENEIILEGEYGEYESEESSELGENLGEEQCDEAQVESGSEVSDEQIIEAIRGLLNENEESDIEGSDISINEDPEKDSLQDSEIVDYTPILEDILAQLESDAAARQAQDEINAQTIFEKPLNEFTVSESIGSLFIVGAFIVVFVAFIKHFTYDLWR